MSEENQPNETTPQEKPGSATDTDQLGDGGKKALEAERAANKEANKQIKELQAQLEQYEDVNRTEVEKQARKADKLARDLEEAQATIARYERQALVDEVAAKVGIPREAAHRLQGNTREELEDDAKQLKLILAPDGPRKPAPVPQAGDFGEASRSNGQVFNDFFSQHFS